MFKITSGLPYTKMTIGGELFACNSSLDNKTGNWRKMRPKWIKEKCIQCGLCFPVCPDDAIEIGSDQKRKEFNFDFCKGCGICAKACPFGAIIMVEEEENEES